ncbi:hypothetical protein BZA05DRAFT_6630 [Tricharina praecox]|uniref:uncharacterized protein n=1 Tax=Tricharina praecox TaxID=43433 RepID=UPI00221EFBD9|nr:uncharacterized protein BZA05DRAFT_6630 [Tricharina praecox]KAI5858534.1 hypothetical protein BZA05DRAFT_6630 [Tricharina praecox]
MGTLPRETEWVVCKALTMFVVVVAPAVWWCLATPASALERVQQWLPQAPWSSSCMCSTYILQSTVECPKVPGKGKSPPRKGKSPSQRPNFDRRRRLVQGISPQLDKARASCLTNPRRPVLASGRCSSPPRNWCCRPKFPPSKLLLLLAGRRTADRLLVVHIHSSPNLHLDS